MLNVLRHYDEKSSKVSFGPVLFAILLMVKSCIQSILTNPNN